MSDNNHLSSTKFSDFPLQSTLLQAIDDLGFQYCTPIQAKSLPLILDSKDIMGQASTGTGKTATFLVAIIHFLLKNPSEVNEAGKPRALILAPTRELAQQIHKEAIALTQHTGLSCAVLFGGADYEKQKKRLREPLDIVIATVGRIIDFFKQKLISFRNIDTLVLDEADRMLDMGFIKDVRYLIRKLPPADSRLNLLFSATFNYSVKEFAYELMNNPEFVATVEETQPPKIDQRAYYVANDEKIAVLIGILKKENPSKCIVFINTKVAAERVTAYLKGNDINCGILSGDIPQNKRQQLVKAFSEGTFPVMVATDVAARGLHIPEVSHVINYDLPQDPEDYVHRIGRTGRIGQTGQAINFICETYAFHLPDIEELIGSSIEKSVPEAELVAEIKPPIRTPRKKPHASKKRQSGKPRTKKPGNHKPQKKS